MSSKRTNVPSLEVAKEWLPSLSPAHEVAPRNRSLAWFDDGIQFAIKEESRLRAPNRWSRWRHLVGFAGELATGAYFRTPVNRKIYDDYVGDDGYDLDVTVCGEQYRVEVKTVCDGDLKLGIDRARINEADYFVLCKTSNPVAMVELVGWIRRPDFKQVGYSYSGDSKVYADPRYLSGFEPVTIYPDRIRESQVVDQ